MTSTQLMTRVDPTILTNICQRAFAQMVQMIHEANNRPGKQSGDPKTGGHPASCASSLHILGALHLVARDVHDYVCCKPHASPMDHAFHHLMQVFRKHDDGTWLTPDQGKALMSTLRKFPEPLDEHVFQSYHARSDPDSFQFLPSGSVGIPPVVSVYLALAHRYAKDHKLEVPADAHFWSLIGDSEFREGSLLECMPDVAERLLGNVTWIIDYNRQNLDGTRIPNERGLHSQDCDRIERTALANGWKVIQVRHGSFRQELFKRPGGASIKKLFDGGLSDFEYQNLLFNANPAEMREHCIKHVPASKKIVNSLSDDELVRAFTDLGGHDIEQMVKALEDSRLEPDEPYLVVAHTLKGWGMKCQADPSNHSSLPNKAEVQEILERSGLSAEDPFALYEEGTPEAEYLAQRRDEFRAGISDHLRMRESNRERARENMRNAGGLPETLDVDLSLFPVIHTQWMWGQLATKLVRIGTSDVGGPAIAGAKDRALTDDEVRWKTAADYVLTLSPDVGTSTNIAPTMDQRIYGPAADADSDDVDIKAKHPDLGTSSDAWTRHIRFEIAEANCMSAVAAFGKMGHYTGIPFFPIMTVYDFFIKRALDQLYYNLYWGAEFVILGTPSGITLSPEGAQHSWKSDIQIPNLITWEPLFAVELDWILSDAIKRHMEDSNDGRRGVLIRAVTRGIPQRTLLEKLRTQAASKTELASGQSLKPKDAGAEWGDAVDESSVATMDDAALLGRLRQDCLEGGYALVNWDGYSGYEPGENVVNVFVMGSVATEALEAADVLLELGIYANIYVVSSPELLFGILGDQTDYRHLRQGLGINGDLHAVQGAGESEAGLISIAGRRVPCVAVCDGEAGLMDNIGSIVGVKQITLAVRKFSKCGRPDQVFEYQQLDSHSIVEACGRALSDTAFENLQVSTQLLQHIGGAARQDERPNWRELWPQSPDAGTDA